MQFQSGFRRVHSSMIVLLRSKVDIWRNFHTHITSLTRKKKNSLQKNIWSLLKILLWTREKKKSIPTFKSDCDEIHTLNFFSIFFSAFHGNYWGSIWLSYLLYSQNDPTVLCWIVEIRGRFEVTQVLQKGCTLCHQCLSSFTWQTSQGWC